MELHLDYENNIGCAIYIKSKPVKSVFYYDVSSALYVLHNALSILVDRGAYKEVACQMTPRFITNLYSDTSDCDDVKATMKWFNKIELKESATENYVDHISLYMSEKEKIDALNIYGLITKFDLI